MKNVLSLLKPGGLLLMVEVTNCPVWLQAIFGTLEGWWKFTDHNRRSIGPILTKEVCQHNFVIHYLPCSLELG